LKTLVLVRVASSLLGPGREGWLSQTKRPLHGDSLHRRIDAYL
jgi:hypothetical protein